MSDNPVPGLQLMLEHLNEVKSEWFMIGIALGVPLTRLREIEASYPQGGVKRWLAEMVQYWLDMTPTACWEQIAGALEQVNQLTLASSIKQKYLWGQSPSINVADHELRATGSVATAEIEIEADRTIVRQLRDLGFYFALMLSNVRKLQIADCEITEAQCFLNDLSGTSDFHGCEKIADLTGKLCRGYIDTFNVYYLEKVATCLSREDMKCLVNEYEEKKQKFFEETTVLDFQRSVVSKAKPPLPEGKVEITIMVQKQMASKRVLRDMELLATEVFGGIHSRFVSFHAIPGSVILLWHVPESLCDRLEQLALDKAVKLRKKGVKKMTIGGKCVFQHKQHSLQETTREESQGLTTEQQQRITKKKFQWLQLVPRDRDTITQAVALSPTGSISPRCRSPGWERSGSFRRTRSYRKLKPRTQRDVGIVISEFNCLYADELTLQLGERIEIISKDTIVSRNIGWWTGRNSRGKIGIFPAACVKVVSTELDSLESSKMEKYHLEIPFDEVKIKEIIGMGGFGKVHRAIYQNEEVAVKVARNTSYDTVRAITEVLSKAERIPYLAHKNLCALVGVCLLRTDVCLVTEYAKGGPLSKVLHERNLSLPVDIILNWSKQIASGMEYLHHEIKPSLVHIDLKSSNILLQNVVDTKKLHGNIIKITDFGLAQEIEQTIHMSGAEAHPWMAPEAISSSEFSQKSDVWSFGVVLWEMLTGVKPYVGLSLFMIGYGVGHSTLSLPIPTSCPTALSDLLTACWNHKHSLRPSFTISKQILTSIENSDFSQTSHQDFHSLQHSWKQEVHKHFEELKKVEQKLHSKKQQIEAELKKKDADLQKREDEMMAGLREQFKELSMQREKRPPRIFGFTPLRLKEWLTEKFQSSTSDESTTTAAGGEDRESNKSVSSKESGYNSIQDSVTLVLRSNLAMGLRTDSSCKKRGKHGHHRGLSDGAITVELAGLHKESTPHLGSTQNLKRALHDSQNTPKKPSSLPINIVTQRNRSFSGPSSSDTTARGLHHHTGDEPSSVSPQPRKRISLHKRPRRLPSTITRHDRALSEPSFDMMHFTAELFKPSVSNKLHQQMNHSPASSMRSDCSIGSILSEHGSLISV